MDKLFSELRRRHVFKVAGAYGVVAWLLIQVAATTFPAFGAPAWVLRVVIALAVLGLPVALVLAWAFELTPEGVRRAEPLASGEDQSRALRKRSFDNRAAGWVGVGILVGLVSVGAYSWTSMTETATNPASGGSLAVLPFANGSADPSDAYLSEGIAEEILNALSQVPQLRVAARTSSFSFQGQSVGLDSIARALNVDYVLEGSVRAAGNRVRIMARLVDASTGSPVWSRSYDRDLEDVLAVQEEIAVAIANALQVKLAGGDASHLTRSRTTDPEAYELYLRGRHLIGQRTPEVYGQAIESFQAAVKRDPAFAAAYSGLADAYALSEDAGVLTREEAFPKALAAAERALELDELQAEAHTSLGHIYFHQENFAAAEKAFRRALELNPSYALAHHWYGNLLLRTDRLPEAVRAYERAVTLDPLSLPFRYNLATTLYYARRFDDAVAALREVRQAKPEDYLTKYWLAWALMGAGEHAEAIAAMQGLLDPIPTENLASRQTHRAQLAIAYAAAGRRDEAEEILRELEALYSGETEVKNNVLYYLALGNDLLGDRDRAFHWLNRAVENPTWMRNVLPIHPAFDSLRPDPRFAEVLRRADQLSAAGR